ncbi:MAG TPA: cysteine desulfurase family protein [Anaerolineaceae bacterium]|nr:cysteine desulfurase family protein [Anaerolineaceae bacterium]
MNIGTDQPVYLDYAATTPVDERVLAVMLPYFTDFYGNPSSIHYFGQQAERALENARRVVAECLNARNDEIIFTACGTESDNLALRGVAFAQRKLKNANHILISPVEHHAVANTARQLAEEFGFEVEFLPVDEFGRVDPNDVTAMIRPETALVSVIYANNEIGTINPVSQIGLICHQKGIPFHTDAVQAAAHLPIDVQADLVDLLSVGGHKLYGPKGVGALYVRRGTPIMPVETGGKQEGGLRAGTQNVPYIVGMAEAFQLAQIERQSRAGQLVPLRDHLIERILAVVPRARLTGHPVERLPNHASFVFEKVDGNLLLMLLNEAGFACSSGSACKVGAPEPSEILTAIGLSRNWSLGSLRLTLGRQTTLEHVDRLINVLPSLVEKTRTLQVT